MSGIGIEVTNVWKRLKQKQALSGVAMSFAPGLLHGLIGANGAGKTTLMRMLIGLLKPDEGEIRFDRNGKTMPFPAVRPGMAYMPQQQSLYPDLSVGEHLDFFRDLYRLPQDAYAARRRDLLSMTRLAPFIDRPAAQLSGGMYKKLGLMCALLQAPNVLLLDEPTTGVDPISRREFWDMLYRSSSTREVTIVLTTAYMDEAERCERVHLLHDGQTVAEGEPRAILAKEGVKSFDELFLRRAGMAE